MKRLLRFIKPVYFFFPVQLLLLSLRKNMILNGIWLVLFLVLTRNLGLSVGTPFFLLDPEYLGQVGYLSFALVGIGLAMFYVSWNLTLYMLHSHRFAFLASIDSPLAVFFWNNSLVPVSFLITYIYRIISFQREDELSTFWPIFTDVAGLLAGIIFILLCSVLFFELMNRNARQVLYKSRETKPPTPPKMRPLEMVDVQSPNRVDYYLSLRGHVRHTRSVDHYQKELTQIVFRYHHISATFGLLLSLLILFAVGFQVENPVFQIPTATSALVLFSILTGIMGVILYWAGNWGSPVLVLLAVLFNLFTKYDNDILTNRVPGIYYNYKTPYTQESIRSTAHPDTIRRDMVHMEGILENWKRKCNREGLQKPKLVIINASGGGLRSAMFTAAVLQVADSLCGGKLYPQTFLMCGASGGMFGLTAIREKILQHNTGQQNALYDDNIPRNIAKDLLNPTFANALSTDLFFPLHSTTFGGQKLFRDRGVMLDKQLIKNNPNAGFQKTLLDYQQAEQLALAPLIIWHTAIINDSRKFFISSQPVSFLMRPVGTYTTEKNLVVDGIDYGRFFSSQNPYATPVASVNRINATFPFVLPNPQLPTDPPTFVMDGGALDNFGNETTSRFLNTFRNWILENTSGVVLLQIRDMEKDKEIEPMRNMSALGRILDPIGMFYNNLENIQDFSAGQKIGYVNESLKGKLQIIYFEYINEVKEKKAVMSFHLTEKNKKDIMGSLQRKNNQEAIQRLNIMLNDSIH